MILATLILDIVLWLGTMRRCGFGGQSIPFAGSFQETSLYPQATVQKEMLCTLYLIELFVCCVSSCSVVCCLWYMSVWHLHVCMWERVSVHIDRGQGRMKDVFLYPFLFYYPERESLTEPKLPISTMLAGPQILVVCLFQIPELRCKLWAMSVC